MDKISIVIPIYNEEKILLKQINKLIKNLKRIHLRNYEIILVNNGSTDRTLFKAKRLAKKIKNLKVLEIKKPLYGEAIRLGFLKAKYNTVVQFDIDFFDFSFLKKGVQMKNKYPIIIGSKLHSQSKDKRPIFRILLSRLFSFFIKLILGYHGTDTHGIKIFNKKKTIFFIKRAVCDNHLFDTEVLLRAEKAGVPIKELPVSLKELRPSRFSHKLRIISLIKEMFILMNFFSIKKRTL
mgnify:FL=1